MEAINYTCLKNVEKAARGLKEERQFYQRYKR